jgi:hypothetical protein
MSEAVVASLRDSLEASFDATAEPAPEPVADPAPPPVETDAVTAAPPTDEASETEEARDRKRDEKGRFAKAEAEKAEAEAKKLAAQPAPAGEKPTTEKPAAPSPSAPRAPQSWKPDAREEWSKLTPRVQQEVLRREGEVQRALQESSEARQGFQKYKESVAPFENMIRAEGGDTLQAVQGLLQTAHMLRTAPPHVRAAGIARMVQNFLPGREGLELLDAALSGQAPQQQAQPRETRDPRLDDLLAQIEQQRTAAAKQQEIEAAKQVQEVSQEEFFEDVRQDMADLVELAQKRGVVLPLRDAYNRAVALHPEVSKVVAQRAAAQRTPQGATQRAKAASSSIKPSPAIAPRGEPGNTGSLREDLERSVAELESGGR